MTFLSLGLNKIIPELFLEIKNNPKNGYKPTGGIWATQHIESINYNPWVDEICSCKNKHKLYSYLQKFNFKLQGIFIVLKNEQKIFMLDSLEKYNILMEKYSNNSFIDYEKLAKDFDGFYIDVNKIYDPQNPTICELIKQFSVSSLILFNLKQILCYQKAIIDIEHFDLDDYYYTPLYSIKISKDLNYVEPPQKKREDLLKIIKEFIIENKLEENQENANLIKNIYQHQINDIYGYDNMQTKEELILRKTF